MEKDRKVPLSAEHIQLPSIDEIAMLQRNVEYEANEEFGIGFDWQTNDGGVKIALIAAGLVADGRVHDAALLLRVARAEFAVHMAAQTKARGLEVLRRMKAEQDANQLGGLMPIIEPKKGTLH